VYRGLEHDPRERLAAACDRYGRAISLGAVSKAHGLPGLRVGWLATREPQLIERAKDVKLYTTICSSAPSEQLVALAVRHSEQLIAANRELVLANLGVLDALLERRSDLLRWVRPTAGPVGFPRVAGEEDVHAWCERIAAEAGVLLLPGSVYGQPRHVRLGFGRANLPEAVERLEGYLEHL
jgi:aspartate/methionine/tyrosine aminotransferase